MCTIPQIVFDLSHTTKIYNVTTKLVLCCQLDSLAKKTAVLSYPSSLLIPYDESRVNSRQVEMAITRAEDTAITHVLNVRLYTAERKQIDLSERLEAQPPLLFYSTAPVLRFDKVTPFCLIQFNNPPHLHHTPNYILEIEVKSGSTSLTRAIEIFFRVRFAQHYFNPVESILLQCPGDRTASTRRTPKTTCAHVEPILWLYRRPKQFHMYSYRFRQEF